MSFELMPRVLDEEGGVFNFLLRMLFMERKLGDRCEGEETTAVGAFGLFGDRKTDLSAFGANLECDTVISTFFTEPALGGNEEFDWELGEDRTADSESSFLTSHDVSREDGTGEDVEVGGRVMRSIVSRNEGRSCVSRSGTPHI